MGGNLLESPITFLFTLTLTFGNSDFWLQGPWGLQTVSSDLLVLYCLNGYLLGNSDLYLSRISL